MCRRRQSPTTRLQFFVSNSFSSQLFFFFSSIFFFLSLPLDFLFATLTINSALLWRTNSSLSFQLFFLNRKNKRLSTEHACTKCNLITNWTSHDQKAHFTRRIFTKRLRNRTDYNAPWSSYLLAWINRVCCDPLFAFSYHRRRAFKFKTKVTQNGLDSLVLYKCCSAATAAVAAAVVVVSAFGFACDPTPNRHYFTLV